MAQRIKCRMFRTLNTMPDIWNSQKYLIEATIPEMSICTDCILSRLTIINVEQADLGYYYINATSQGFPPEYGKITLYRMINS